ncbi:MAG: hypothetical protein JST10_05475, partial [Bacteroidetes bacterium]|nr:hypothetical protein [Bacteroidota bacterium]
IFNKANAYGVEHIDEVIAANSFDHYDLKKYYTHHLNYFLDGDKKKAIQLFLKLISPK